MTVAEWAVLAVAAVFFLLGRWWERGKILIDSIREDERRDAFMQRERLP